VKFAQKKQKKVNPHCPVPGCRATKPHADDPIVQGIIAEFALPEKMAAWVCAAMSELGQSISRDLAEGKWFAWHSRLRQPEEMYIRTLYAIFIADEKELHHILSGDTPNGLSGYYKAVNECILEGRGLLLVDQPGLTQGTFKPIETLHDGAHVSFKAFLTCIGFVKNPQYRPSAEAYTKHLVTYCRYLTYMRDMFKAGKSKQDVLDGLRNLHKPAEHWKEQQAKVKAAS